MRLAIDTVRRLPKVVLHDHIHGGIRPATLLELARDAGDDRLPAADEPGLARWLADTTHTAAAAGGPAELPDPALDLVQTETALTRVATECVLDLAADGVVYAEVRLAPERHTRGGLGAAGVVEAVLAGLGVGAARARLRGHTIRVGLLLTALRQAADSWEIADLAVRYRDHGVVGFDVGGPETGFPPTRHVAACEHVQRENFNLTIHAGEGFGPSAIWEAIQWCGADRLGHGVRIADEIAVADDGTAKLGRLAAYARDKRVPLELCPGLNVSTGVVSSLAEHPVETLRRLRFRVTVNTGHRTLGQTSMTRELTALADTFGYQLPELRWFTVNAMKSAFVGHDERLDLIERVIKPAYAREQVVHAGAAFHRREDPW